MVILVTINPIPVFCQEQPGRIVFDNMSTLMDTIAIHAIIHEARVIKTTNPDSAILLYKKAYAAAESANDTHAIKICLQELSGIYVSKGMNKEVLSLFQGALLFCSWQPLRSITLLPLIYNGLATINKIQGNYEQATRYYEQAMLLSERQSNVGNGAIYVNMGSVLLSLDQYDKALYYLNKAEQVARHYKGYAGYEVLANTLVSKGQVCVYRKQWKQSEAFYTEALQLAEDHKLVQSQFLALTNMGYMFLNKREPQKALIYLLKARDIKTDINPGYRYNALYAIGTAWYQLQDYDKAEIYLLQALHNAQTFENERGLMKAQELLAEIYETKGDYGKSLRHYKTFIDLREKVDSRKVTENVNELEIKYSSTQKDKEIIANQLALKQKESNLRKKNLWMGGISAGAIILAMAIVWLYRYSRQQNKLQVRKIYILNQEKEIAKLKALMDGEEKERVRIAQELHDGVVVQFTAAKMGVSALSNYHPSLGETPHLDAALQQLNDAIKELRKTAHNLLPDILLEEGLVDALYYFCNTMQQGAAGHQINFISYGELPHLSGDFELHVYRIVQELVHNIIKHAKATEALVQVNYLEELLSITVKDNGKGFDELLIKHKKGAGLKSIQTRTELLNGHIEISSRPGNGTVFYLEFDTKHHLYAINENDVNKSSHSR